MKQIFFFFRLALWVGLIVFFIYFPGDVRIQWLNYDIQTSVFFLFAVFLVVDKIFSLFQKIGRFFFHDLGRDLALSHYKSEVKFLKESENKRLDREKKEAEKQRQKAREDRRKKWNNRFEKLKNLFRR